MQKVLHREAFRGRGDYGWLSTRYSFSFANWFNPSRMGFGTLRVINDDHIEPHSGFDTHSHKDMEIITFVTKGTLTHRDSMGNVGTIKAGEVQAMSAGTGVSHSEHNEEDIPLELFQIWISPRTIGATPRYAEKSFMVPNNELILLAGPDGTPDALPINQDAFVSRAVLAGVHSLTYKIRKKGNGLYLFLVKGKIRVADEVLEEGDAVGLSEILSADMYALERAEILFFEVPLQ